MGFDSIWHWLLLLVIVLLIFGTGKLTKLGPDLGKAMRGFKKGLQGDEGGEDEAKSEAGKEKLQADPPATADKGNVKQEHRDSAESK